MELSMELSKAVSDLMVVEPFFGHLAISLDKSWDDSVGTAGVSLNGININLAVSPKYWESLPNDNYRIGLVWHELLHVAYYHLFTRDMFADKNLHNIAADIAINQHILEQYVYEEQWITLHTFDIDMEALQSTQYYYDKLKENLESNNPDPNLQGLIEFLESGGQAVCSHSTWKTVDGMPDHEKELVEKQIDYVLRDSVESAQKTRGTVPGSVKHLLDKLFKKTKPVADWRKILRQFHTKSQEHLIRRSRRKLNKRFFENPAIKRRPKNKMLVAFDTSGSVSNSDLQRFMCELEHIHKTGTEIDLIMCDTEIAGAAIKYTEIRKSDKFSVKGRGGTYFDPVIEYMNQNKYNSVVYFTDGYAPYPSVKTSKPVLWIITRDGAKDFKPPRSLVVKIED